MTPWELEILTAFGVLLASGTPFVLLVARMLRR